MQRKDALTILRDQVIASEGHQATPGMKAIGYEEALKRGGYTIVPNEVATMVAYIMSMQGIGVTGLTNLVIDMKLGAMVPYDPEVHTGGDDHSLPGDHYLKYSPEFMEVLHTGAAHFRGKMQ